MGSKVTVGVRKGLTVGGEKLRLDSKQREAGSRQREAGSIKTEGWTQNRERLDSGWIKRERLDSGWVQTERGLDSRQREVGLNTCRSLFHKVVASYALKVCVCLKAMCLYLHHYFCQYCGSYVLKLSIHWLLVTPFH